MANCKIVTETQSKRDKKWTWKTEIQSKKDKKWTWKAGKRIARERKKISRFVKATARI